MGERAGFIDLLGTIGSGAYGTVYKARNRTDGSIVALKKITVPLTDEGVPMNTLREIGVLKQLNSYDHPNIVRLLDICQFQQHEQQLLVMLLIFEYVEQDLALYMEKNRERGLTTPQVRTLSREILSGVDFLHSNRIVHRDLKPQNLLVTNDGHIKIADFGLAKTYDFEMILTTVVVTLWYRAPEVLLGIPYATPIDIWSIGCIIAELFHMKPLFCSSSESNQLQQIFKIMGRPSAEEWPENNVSITWEVLPNTSRERLSQRIPTMDEVAEDLIYKMLTFVPEKRISAKEALEHEFFTEEPI